MLARVISKGMQILRRDILIFIGIILLITAVSYYPALKNGMLEWDDNAYIINNPKIHHISLKSLSKIATSFDIGNYQPVTLLSYAIEYHFGGGNPRLYHATNIALHFANCALLFWLILLISGSSIASFITALLFGIHPMHVESVAWIAERKDVLFTFFYFSAFISYIYRIKTDRPGYCWLSFLFFIFSLLSKSMAVTLPLVLILYDYCYAKKPVLKSFKNKIPFLVAAAGIAVVNQYAQHKEFFGPGTIIFDHKLYDRIFFPAYVLIFQLIKTFIPYKLSAVYPYMHVIDGQLRANFYLYAILAAVLVTVAWRRRHTADDDFFGLSFFTLTLLPVLQIVPLPGVAITADRYNYIPSIGLFYIAGQTIARFYAEKSVNHKILRALFLFFLVSIMGLLSLLTWQRCKVWKDGATLYNDVLSMYPETEVMLNNLGLEYNKSGDHDKAIFYYNAAIRINPKYALAYHNRGAAYGGKQEWDNEIRDSEHALRLNPLYPYTYHNLGRAYLGKQNYKKAIEYYSKLIELAPDNINAYVCRALIYYEAKQYDKAIPDYLRAAPFTQQDSQLWYSLANCYFLTGKYIDAVAAYSQVITLNPNMFEAYANRGASYFYLGEYDKTIADYTATIKINPNCAMAYNGRGSAYAKKGEFAKAKKDAIKALTLGFKLPANLERLLQ